MTATASPRYRPNPTTTPAARPPHSPASVGQAMAPLLSPAGMRPPSHNPQPRSPSPNYFGFAPHDSSYHGSAAQHAKQNWSPPSSTVRSTAAMSPSVVPVDQNPEFEAFRRQSEGKIFNLGNLHTFKMEPPPPRRPTHGRTLSKQSNEGAKAVSEPREMQARHPGKNDSLDPESANLGRSPKRQLSSDSTNFPGMPRRASPASFSSDGPSDATDANAQFRPRSPLPLDRFASAHNLPKHRAETLPASTENESLFVTPQHVVNLLESASEEILILDLRVSTQYANSRITGALSLCIPTTLLKRPSFNVQKLAETFKDSEQRSKFENWRNSKYIIVYDSSSAQAKDATTCLNTIKKFNSEGYEGTTYIVKGGFADFSRRFSQYVDRHTDTSPASATGPPKLTLDRGGPEIAPVIGGCPMPQAKNAANPFFGNIRQNMDLIGGVGQMPVKCPQSMSSTVRSHLPKWLKQAAEEKDQGARVSDKFLQIEKREQKRMQDALSGKVTYGEPAPDMPKSVQIAGIEKGSKNRYNNIWPFEHSRVKLQDVPDSGCDYFNATYVQSQLSNKRYIATQAPIPATFTDFWNVVWQQDVRVIVMLTAEKEGGQVKAHNYWDQKQYGPLHLEFLSERRASLEPSKIKKHRHRPSNASRRSTDATPLARLDSNPKSPDSDQPFVIVRKMTLRHDGHPFQRMREVTQLQYSSWPDFGAPAHPAHLLGLVEQCDAVVRSTTATRHSEPDPPNTRPVLVHCSAGCGRTGTFCTVDTVIDMLKRQRTAAKGARHTSPMDIDSEGKPDNPFFASAAAKESENDIDMEGAWLDRDDQDLVEKTVEDFRHQRLSMVQSLRQFVLCYESIMEWLVEQDSE